MSGQGGSPNPNDRRIPFGEENHRAESPCPGCGVYYFDIHEPGCPIEECPACGGQRAECGCDER